MQMYFRIRHVDRYVGILVVLAVVLVVVALVFLARGQQWFAKRSMYRVTFSRVQGLKPGTSVTISGMEVGQVKSLHLTPQSKVELILDVLQKYGENIRQDSRATVAMALLGGKSVEITVGSPGQPSLPEGSIIPSEEPKEITDLLKEIDFKTPLKKLDDALENLKSITQKLNDPRGELFTLLKSVEFVTAQLKNGQGNVGAILQDPKMHREIMASLESIRRSLSRVEEATQNASDFSRILPGAGEEVARAAKEVPEVLQDVKKAVSDLPPIMENVRKAASHAAMIAEDLRDIARDGKVIARDVKEITGSVQKGPPRIPDLMASTQETVEDADQLIQGLKNHWLLRGSMPRVKEEMPLTISERESPYRMRGDASR
jgi:phospholipid/cholesterol/gamma-HCH transport system substrate-binding protein